MIRVSVLPLIRSGERCQNRNRPSFGTRRPGWSAGSTPGSSRRPPGRWSSRRSSARTPTGVFSRLSRADRTGPSTSPRSRPRTAPPSRARRSRSTTSPTPGDGWNSTYAVAYWITRPVLELEAEGRTHATRRGDVLLFGGDQVYPTASRAEYELRLVSPFEAALNRLPDPKPSLFAIPGNHDWYDSLVSFTRLFISKKFFAAWETPQRRSYFALKLPHDWWLVGTDVQLGSDIDEAAARVLPRRGGADGARTERSSSATPSLTGSTPTRSGTAKRARSSSKRGTSGSSRTTSSRDRFASSSRATSTTTAATRPRTTASRRSPPAAEERSSTRRTG